MIGCIQQRGIRSFVVNTESLPSEDVLKLFHSRSTAPSSYWYLRHFDLPGLLTSADWVNVMYVVVVFWYINCSLSDTGLMIFMVCGMELIPTLGQ
jgi:hypothetical protein